MAVPDVVTASSDDHSYFNALLARPELFKSYALRSQAQIDGHSATKPNTEVTYDSTVDAAKVTIQPFHLQYPLGQAALPEDDRLVLTYVNTSLMTNGRSFKIGNEIVTIYDPPGDETRFPSPLTVRVLRGQFGTTAAAHAAGAIARLSNNSLRNQVRVPLGTTEGSTYFITWDALFTDSYFNHSLDGHKTFQLADGSVNSSSIWLETRTRYNGQDALGKYPGFDRTKHIAMIDGRSYNTSMPGSAGSTMTDNDPLSPQVGRFPIRPNVWVRFTWLIEQNSGAYDRASLWAADVDTPPVKLYDRITVEARGTPPMIAMFYIEFSASMEPFRGRDMPLVSYIRNLVVLRNISDPIPLLQRPGTATLPSWPPSPPRNLRITK